VPGFDEPIHFPPESLWAAFSSVGAKGLTAGKFVALVASASHQIQEDALVARPPDAVADPTTEPVRPTRSRIEVLVLAARTWRPDHVTSAAAPGHILGAAVPVARQGMDSNAPMSVEELCGRTTR